MELFRFFDTVLDSIENAVSLFCAEILHFFAACSVIVGRFYRNEVVPLLSDVKTLEDLLEQPKLLLVLVLCAIVSVLAVNLAVRFLVFLLRWLFTCICYFCCYCCRRRTQFPRFTPESSFVPKKKKSGTALERFSEAKRWMRQAEQDLNATKNDLVSSAVAAPEWAAFKCQQAAEKSLKACLISVDIGAVNIRGHDLHDLAVMTHDRYLIEVSQKIQSLIGYIGRLRYPDFIAAPYVPHDVINEEQVDEAVGLCTLLVNDINSRYMNFEEK